MQKRFNARVRLRYTYKIEVEGAIYSGLSSGYYQVYVDVLWNIIVYRSNVKSNSSLLRLM